MSDKKHQQQTIEEIKQILKLLDQADLTKQKKFWFSASKNENKGEIFI